MGRKARIRCCPTWRPQVSRCLLLSMTPAGWRGKWFAPVRPCSGSRRRLLETVPRPVIVFTSDGDADHVMRATESRIHASVISGGGAANAVGRRRRPVVFWRGAAGTAASPGRGWRRLARCLRAVVGLLLKTAGKRWWGTSQPVICCGAPKLSTKLPYRGAWPFWNRHWLPDSSRHRAGQPASERRRRTATV